MRNYLFSMQVGVILCLTSLTHGGVVYSNDFNSGPDSLNDFKTFTYSSFGATSVISIDSGQLKIQTEGSGRGFAVLNMNDVFPQYSTILNNNPGLISWSFNVSNQNTTFNNSCSIALASSEENSSFYTSTAYYLGIGGYVGDRMMLARHGYSSSETAIIDINNGLPPLPYKGSFRITYNPSNRIWSLYGHIGQSYINPTTVNSVMGFKTDSTYTDKSLPYITFSASEGIAYFDNFTLEVDGIVPEPATLLFFGLGGLILRKRRK